LKHLTVKPRIVGADKKKRAFDLKKWGIDITNEEFIIIVHQTKIEPLQE
jgi:hypothetical protein